MGGGRGTTGDELCLKTGKQQQEEKERRRGRDSEV